MQYFTPKSGDRYSLRDLYTGLIVKGVVSTSFPGVGFRLEQGVYLDTGIGKYWVPLVKRMPLENK